MQTIQHLKQAGIKICSGGILGMGETREDRCELAFALKKLGAHIVPMNFLNPIAGTPFAQQPLAPLEILKSIACFCHSPEHNDSQSCFWIDGNSLPVNRVKTQRISQLCNGDMRRPAGAASVPISEIPLLPADCR